MKKKNKIKRRYLFVFLLAMVSFTACTQMKTTSEEKNDSKSEKEVIDIMVDWKELQDPREKYPDEGTQTGETKPQIVQTKYETKDVVIADIIPTKMGYAVDPTGKTDSTEGIQQALYDCYDAGGGTVYLPAGNYAITDTISIPQYVTLRGDWNDPDISNEYGTVISVWMDPSDELTGGAFLLDNCSGTVGLTVYYPFQSLYEVLPYPCTFFVADTAQCMSIKNVTVLNGYRGIGTSVEVAHEILIVENFKGTFLYNGAELNNASDAGRMESYYISPKYWIEASEGYMNKPVEEELRKYMKENTTGMIISDLEWNTFNDIHIEGCAVGIQVVAGFRIEFAGAMYDVEIKDCEKGFYSQAIDERWGMVIARSSISGGLTHEWIATIRATDVDIEGGVEEIREGTVELNKDDLSSYDIDYNRSYIKPKNELIVAELDEDPEKDVSDALQALINVMGQQGGGVVYVPGGTYRFDKPITIPAGVELRGATSVSQREVYKDNLPGTRFMCYYGDDASYNKDNDAAFITLVGDDAGVNGIRITYPENSPLDADLNTTYAIRGKGTGNYVVNTFIAAAAYGIDFRGCDNHYLEGNYTGCYYNSYILGGKNGMLKGCLHNPTMVIRMRSEHLVDWLEPSKSYAYLTNPITRKNLQNVIVDGAENEVINSLFGYGCKNFVVNRNSKNTLVVNVGSDNLNGVAAQLVNENGDMIVINDMRFNGHSYDNTNGELRLYNRIAINEADLEKNEIIGGE